MCLAIPGKILSIAHDDVGRHARIDLGGLRQTVRLDLLPDAGIGDYVVVHVGFAISRMRPDEAERTLRLLHEVAQSTGSPPETP